jgi:hypothetical protein
MAAAARGTAAAEVAASTSTAATAEDQTGTLGGFLEPPATTPLGKAQLRQRDIAAASRRVAALAVEEARLQSEMSAARAAAANVSTVAGPSHLLELEQDLRHVLAERAWLERNASTPVRP